MVLRFAVVSYAHMHAWSYTRAIKELEAEGKASLVAVFDNNSDRLRRVQEAFKPKAVYNDFDKLLAEGGFNAAIVASENAKHVTYALPLIRAGVHVIVEKPITTMVSDAVTMVNEAEKRGVKLQVAFVMRYHDAVVEAKNRVSELGGIKSITATNHGTCPFDWFVDPELAGGGAMMDHIVHAADLIRWFTGKEFEEVSAFVGKNIRPELKVEDNALILAKLSDGTPVSIDSSWSRHETWPIWGDVYMRILTEHGVLTINAFNQNISLADNKGFHWVSFGPDADRNMVEDFIRVVENNLTPRASGLDGLRALEVVAAAYRSWREGRPIKISEVRVQ
ncbi:Gfo/Idh/MocA family protein [Caldivirga sp.]|jgi:predicted dehydrogenase|uniref:Gfo/Idh/MocA family protein n=1 Tax=Caldivirga sp. TaxID=2080243 RepID=UPI003D131730